MDYAPAALAHQLDGICMKIGNDAADELGFVPIRELLKRFQIQLIARPLLVEGMLATIDSLGESARSSCWAVLIDSETHELSDELISTESSERPLHIRARNTIAHELAHSLAFRPSEFGIQLRGTGRAKKHSDFIKAIERETERLSPLLLVTEKALDRFSITDSSLSTATAVAQLREALGVSRDVLVSRLQMLRSRDDKGLLARSRLRNLAIGIVDWTESGAVIRNWPLFMNFDRNVVPEFLLQVLAQDRTLARNLGIPDQSALCGGPEVQTAFETDGRCRGAVTPERMAITIGVEPRRRGGQSSIFVARRSEDGSAQSS